MSHIGYDQEELEKSNTTYMVDRNTSLVSVSEYKIIDWFCWISHEMLDLWLWSTLGLDKVDELCSITKLTKLHIRS